MSAQGLMAQKMLSLQEWQNLPGSTRHRTRRSRRVSLLSVGHTFGFTEDGAIAVSEPQIVAVVCQLLPKEPNPDPVLLPDS